MTDVGNRWQSRQHRRRAERVERPAEVHGPSGARGQIADLSSSRVRSAGMARATSGSMGTNGHGIEDCRSADRRSALSRVLAESLACNAESWAMGPSSVEPRREDLAAALARRQPHLAPVLRRAGQRMRSAPVLGGARTGSRVPKELVAAEARALEELADAGVVETEHHVDQVARTSRGSPRAVVRTRRRSRCTRSRRAHRRDRSRGPQAGRPRRVPAASRSPAARPRRIARADPARGLKHGTQEMLRRNDIVRRSLGNARCRFDDLAQRRGETEAEHSRVRLGSRL